MTRAQILDTAKNHITKDRNATHGEPEDSFRRIAEYWSVHLNIPLKPEDVGIMMTLFKIARAESNPLHEDNWIDGAGYLACAGEIASKSTQTGDTHNWTDEVQSVEVKRLKRQPERESERYDRDMKSLAMINASHEIALERVTRERDAAEIQINAMMSQSTESLKCGNEFKDAFGNVMYRCTLRPGHLCQHEDENHPSHPRWPIMEKWQEKLPQSTESDSGRPQSGGG